MSLCQIGLPVCTEMPLAWRTRQDYWSGARGARSAMTAPSELSWESRRTVPGTRDAFARTGSVSGCQRSGGAKFSAADARRAVNALPSSFRPSTPAPDPSSTREGHRFTRRQRITRGADLQRIAREGKRFRTASLDVRVVVTPNQHGRIGFIVPKHGRSAVHRNRLKRALRELTRHLILGVLRTSKAGPGMDIVMRALPSAYAASFGALRDELQSLPARLDRLRAVAATAQDGSAPSSG